MHALCVHVYMCVRMFMYAHTGMCVCMCSCVHACVYVRVCTRACVHVCVHVYVCACVCVRYMLGHDISRSDRFKNHRIKNQ